MCENGKFEFPYSICIPGSLGTGGGNATFWNYFMRFLKEHNILYHRNIFKKSDFMMLNSWQGTYLFYKLSSHLYPKRINVHRINGSAREYGRHGDWDERQKRIGTIADIRIFQSNYSKYVTTLKHSIVRSDGHIIFNTVNTDLFNPHGEKLSLSGSIKIAFCSASKNPKKGFSEVVEIAQRNNDLTFVIAGYIPEMELPKNIIILGYLSQDDISKMLRSCDLFIFCSENEACPNVVLEALSSGLPVLYKNSGGTPELVGDAGMSICVDTFRQCFETLWGNYKHYKTMARLRAERYFTINKIIPSYLGEMRTFMEV